MTAITEVPDIDGDELDVYQYPGGARVIVSLSNGGTRDYDREGAVRLIEVLTDAVQAHDEVEAAKLKRGDKVFSAHHSARGMTYMVLSDEENGRVDVVSLNPNATVYEDRDASTFTVQSRPRRVGRRPGYISSAAPF